MAIPDGCELTATHLVFWELAAEEQLADTEKLYEFCCTVACTNALRPLGVVEIERHPIPDLRADRIANLAQRRLAQRRKVREPPSGRCLRFARGQAAQRG